MIILFNNLNDFKNNQAISQTLKTTKINSKDLKRFHFEDEFFDFFNYSFSKSFNNTKRVSVLYMNDSIVEKDHNWSILEANISKLLKHQNIVFLIASEKDFKILSKKVPNNYYFSPFKRSEIKALVSKKLKDNKIKYDFYQLNDLLNLSEDPYFLENELEKILLLKKSVNHKPFDATFKEKDNLLLLIFQNFFSKNYLKMEEEINKFISRESIYLLIEFFIRQLNNLIIYSLENKKSLNNKQYKSNFYTNYYSKDYSLILQKNSLDKIQNLQIEFLDFKDLYLFNKASNLEEIVVNKFKLLSRLLV